VWQARTLSWCGVRHLFICWRSIAAQGCFPPKEREYKPPWTHKWHHLVSHSHTSQARSPCPMKRTKVTRLRWGLPTINDTWKRHTQTWRIPKWLLHQVWPSASNPPPFNIAQADHTRIARGLKGEARQQRPPQPPKPVPFWVRLPT
jgi:hypothetical protein